MGFDLRQSDIFIALATLLGPILAVQAQKWIEVTTEHRRSRSNVFNVLMATRGTRLAPEHVAALNSIDVIFAPPRGGMLSFRQRSYNKTVVDAWHIYAAHLNSEFDKSNPAIGTQWVNEGNRLFVDLMMSLAQAVGFPAERDRVQGVYHPTGHFEREQAQLKVLNNAAMVFAGEQPLKMNVVAFPFGQQPLSDED